MLELEIIQILIVGLMKLILVGVPLLIVYKFLLTYLHWND